MRLESALISLIVVPIALVAQSRTIERPTIIRTGIVAEQPRGSTNALRDSLRAIGLDYAVCNCREFSYVKANMQVAWEPTTENFTGGYLFISPTEMSPNVHYGLLPDRTVIAAAREWISGTQITSMVIDRSGSRISIGSARPQLLGRIAVITSEDPDAHRLATAILDKLALLPNADSAFIPAGVVSRVVNRMMPDIGELTIPQLQQMTGALRAKLAIAVLRDSVHPDRVTLTMLPQMGEVRAVGTYQIGGFDHAIDLMSQAIMSDTSFQRVLASH